MSDKFHDFVGMTTDVSVLLRELCIVAFFCLLFFAPVTFKLLLTRIGISKVTTPMGDIDIGGAGGTVATLNRGLSDSITGLQQIQSTSTDSPTSHKLQAITQYLTNLQQEAANTDETIKSNLVTQQASLEKTSPQSAKTSGWLFVGHVAEDKLHWFGDSTRNVSATLSPKLTTGEKLSMTSTAYLRTDAPSETHLGTKVIGVVPANREVEVIADPFYSPAIAGGYFLWAKVQPI
jgi:hypothetical protein